MKNKKSKTLISIGILGLVLLFLYYSLPFLISFASNILYLGVFLILGIIAIYFFAKWFFK
jgi:hypothetical protein